MFVTHVGKRRRREEKKKASQNTQTAWPDLLALIANYQTTVS